MKKYAKNIDDRKVLVDRLTELTGQVAHYTRVPRCAYEVGAFTVEKDGSLTVEDGADEMILQALKDENLIGAELEVPAPTVRVIPGDQPAAAIREPDFGDEDWGEDEESASEPAETDHQEQSVWQPDTDIFAGMTESPEIPDAGDEPDADGAADADWVSDSEYEQEAAEEAAASLGVRDAEPEAQSEERSSGEGCHFPIYAHSVASITNLICLMYTRGPLLSKATGGHFHADKELVDAILDDYKFRTKEDLIAFIREWEGGPNALAGISFSGDEIVIDGFPSGKDEDHRETFRKLAKAINKMALTQNRVQAKEVNMDNEKYTLRIWLIRLGMNGDDCKADRKRLMANLTGHTAFRTEEEKERAKVKALRKRDALRAIKAEAAQANTETAGA